MFVTFSAKGAMRHLRNYIIYTLVWDYAFNLIDSCFAAEDKTSMMFSSTDLEAEHITD